ncbi:hypothetical protein VTO42DRAFT_8111 [Malbranchea cinnamomea]
MAKGKGKRRSSTGAATTPGAGSTDVVKNAVDSLPNLSEGVLSKLTKTIEQKLQEDTKAKPQNPKKAGPVNNKELQFSNKPAAKKGKKRDRSGKVIPQKSNSNPAENLKASKSDDALEKEIYAIGGTREDYDLVAGVESGSEVDGDGDEATSGKGKNDDDALRNDIAKLLGGADIRQSAASHDKSDAKSKTPAPSKAKETPLKESSSSKPKNKGEKKLGDGKSNMEKEKKQVSNAAQSGLEIEPRPDWYATPLPEVALLEKSNITVARHIVDRIREYAMSLLEAENKAFANNQQSSSSYKFYSTIVTSGTLSDKISALTLAVQESPVHNTKALEALIGLARKRSRAQAVEVLRSLKDLFAQGTLLPSDRRLKSFAHQPTLLAAFEGVSPNWSSADGLPGGLERRHLIIWAFEDFLKAQYFEVLKILEIWCNDEIEFSRSRALTYVYELLKEKPEQESNLLRLLVNKLGDPGRKIASRASYLLLQLEQAHPLMKSTIISAIESELLFRPGQSKHAQYYGVITLNQTILSKAEEKVAAQLLDIYFSLFVSLLKSPKDLAHDKADRDVKQKGKKQAQRRNLIPGEAQDKELREKLISAILTGVNRAYPFTTSNTERLSNHINTLFRITHSSNFNTSIQALTLIQQLSSNHQVSADRFYRTLYESLLDPRIVTSSKQSMYLNLLYKALKADLNMKRIKAFIKRLVQILTLHQPSFTCGVFYLIRELETTYPSLTSLVDQPEDHESDDEEVFRDVPDEDEQVSTEPAMQEQQRTRKNAYDSRKRDPEQSNADNSCLWELLPYLSHFHPSVAVGASQLLHHQKMSGKPDLSLHTLSHFLDRFVYRSPKTQPSLRGSSIMQPLAGGDTSGLLVTSDRSAKTQEPVNSEAFWKKKSEEVAAEDVFFHQYFNRLGKDKLRTKDKAANKKHKGEDESEDGSEAESEIWKALVESKPEIEGGLDSDEDDLDMEDFEEAMAEDEDEGEEGFEDMDVDEEMESGSDGGVIFNDEDEDDEDEGKGPSVTKKSRKHDDEVEDEEAIDFDVSDEEAFRGSDEELPSDLDIAEGEVPDEDSSEAVKNKGAKRGKRRKLKHLPTFASADDYAALLANEDSGNEM